MRRWIAAAGVVAGAGGLAWLVGSRRLTVSRHVVGTAERTGPVLTIAHLSDLHLRSFDGLARRVVETTNRLEPDLVAITGDLVSADAGLSALEELLEELAVGADRFAVEGNWDKSAVDVDRLRAICASAGVRVLVDETAEIDVDGVRVWVTGVDDWVEGSPAWPDALPAGRPDRHLLLSHSPAFRDRILDASRRPDLMLSGHTHGGQVRLPGWAPVLPRGSRGYVSGWYADCPPHLYVSRGIGTSSLPVRLFAPPEIAFFRWGLGSAGETATEVDA